MNRRAVLNTKRAHTPVFSVCTRRRLLDLMFLRFCAPPVAHRTAQSASGDDGNGATHSLAVGRHVVLLVVHVRVLVDGVIAVSVANVHLAVVAKRANGDDLRKRLCISMHTRTRKSTHAREY